MPEKISRRDYQQVLPAIKKNSDFLDADNEITSYQIEEHINATLLYAGTIGLEFSINKTPIKFSKSELEITNQMFENALKYAYYWVNERHIPENAIELEGELIFQKYKFNSSDDLLNNDTVKLVC